MDQGRFTEGVEMKQFAGLLILAFLVTGTVVAGEAEAVTLEGTVMCAKCKLGEEDRTKCQNVLIVKGDDEPMHYYLTADANKDFGDVCMKTPVVRVTGTVSEEDGKTWIAATKIEPVEG